MLDLKTKDGARAVERFRTELIGWLTTVGVDGQPQSSPVWFLWNGETFLVYSLATAPRVRNLASNRRVSFHLNSDAVGDEVVTIEAEATILGDARPASAVPEYIAKYRGLLAEYGWSAEKFSADYPVAIRLRPTRFRFG